MSFGHLWHMPSHITTQTGDYLEAIEQSCKAIEQNKIVCKVYADRAPGNIPAKLFYTFYRCHDVHMLSYASMFCGQYSVCLEECRILREEIMQLPVQDEEYWLAAKLWMDGMLTPVFHVMVRFGLWSKILEFPEQSNTHLASKLAHSYAKCMALTNTNKVDLAKAEYENFKDILENQVKTTTPELFIMNNSVYKTYQIADALIRAEILYRAPLYSNSSNFDNVQELLEEAVAGEDGLDYIEPWGWMHPPRHILGALCIEQKRYDVATRAYLEDLGLSKDSKNATSINPKNIWSTRGLLEIAEVCKDEKVLAKIDVEMLKSWLPELEAQCESVISASCACKKNWANVE